jgi:hypothetical protein
LYGTEVYYPTEFMHGLFDGGHGAGLDDFWNQMQQHRAFSGGFLWSFHDEGVVRDDRGGIIDVAGNAAPDGILGPHREKEGSFYTIREIWSPVQVEMKVFPKQFTGSIPVANKYLYSNLGSCRFEWKTVTISMPGTLVPDEHITQAGDAAPLSLAPGDRGFLRLNMPDTLEGDVFYLSAYDQKNRLICSWSWAMKEPADWLRNGNTRETGTSITTGYAGNIFSLQCDGIQFRFDTATGYLQNVFNGKNEISLSEGPAWAGRDLKLTRFGHYKKDGTYIVQPVYGDSRFWVQWIFQPGKLPKLEYSYQQGGAADYLGITFHYPEDSMLGMQWMGRGPYRVWKNRLKGQQLGVWNKAYNNTITGESWNYPEFKGWHAEMYWVTINTKESPFTIYTDQQNIFLQMLQPQKPKGATNDHTSPPFPAGNLGFMHAISPIGTKFQAAELMGPQSQKNMQLNYGAINGSLYVDFR